MMKNNILMLAGLVLIVGLFFVFKPQTSTSNPATPVTKSYSYVLKDKKLMSGPAKIQVTEGDKLEISVTADKDWPEFHIHGYELKAPIKASVPTTHRFTADKTGSFKLEVHFVEKAGSDTSDDNATPDTSNPNPDEMAIGTLEVQPK